MNSFKTFFHEWRCRRSYGVLYSRGTTTAAAARTRTVRRPCQQRQLGRRNRQRSSCINLWRLLKVCLVAQRAGSHWCRADMCGSANLVLCACYVMYYVWMWDAPFVVRILPWLCAFFLYSYDRLCRSSLATFRLIIATFWWFATLFHQKT